MSAKLRRQFQVALQRGDLQHFPALLGDGTGSVAVSGRSGYVYVRIGREQSLGQAFNQRVPERENLAVIVGYSPERPDLFQVLSLREVYVGAGYDKIPQVVAHHESHEFGNEDGGEDTVWIQKQQTVPMLCCPTSPMSMYVSVMPDWYPWDTGWNYFEGATSADLSGYVPSLDGEARFVLISIDGATNALQYTSGSTFVLGLPLGDLDTRVPAPPLGSVPVCAVYFVGTTTSLDWGNLYDLRLFNSPVGGSITPGAHALLDISVHSDTSTSSPAQGSIIRGTPTWEAYDAKLAGQILVGDGVDIVSVPVSGDAVLASDGTLTVMELLYSVVATQTLIASSIITTVDGSSYRLVDSTSDISLTSEPTIAIGRDGQLLLIKNVGSFDITLQDVNGLGGSLLRLTANSLTIQPSGTMGLIYDATIGFWVETFLLNPIGFTPSISAFSSHLSITREVAAALVEDTAPNYTIAYVGTPSVCVISIVTGSHPGGNYPINVPTPYTALDAGTVPSTETFYRGSTVAATVLCRVTATVAGQSGLTRDLTFTYLNRCYCGPSADGSQLTTTEILALDDAASGTSNLSTSKYGTLSDIDTASGEFIYYCYRSALGTVSHFSIENEAAKFHDEGIVTHTNDLGFVENFQEYRSEVTNLGNNKDFRALSSEANNRVYMGPAANGSDTVTNAQILALDDTADGESIVSSTVARTYTDIQIESGEYLWFCHPDRISDLATIKDATTGFAVAGSYRNNVTHENQFGYEEAYRCWRSDNPGIYPTGENIVVTA